MTTYSITRALAEIKLLKKRYPKVLENAVFIDFKKNSADHGAKTFASPGTIKNDALASYDSATSILNRIVRIKQLIDASNAVTKVTIAGKEMTVQEAINRKTSIELERQLLATMRLQYNNALASVSNANNKVEIEIERKLDAMASSEADKKTEAMLAFANNYRESNQWALIDPLDLKAKIEKLEEEIDSFESEVDYVLSTSNSITTIDIAD